MAGMALNLVSFSLFVSLIVYFDHATRRAYGGDRRIFYPMVCGLYVSWAFIMVSSAAGNLAKPDSIDIQDGRICYWLEWTDQYGRDIFLLLRCNNDVCP